MNAFAAALAVQIVLGGLDNLLHHELTEKLASRASARFELALHAIRELIYGVIFFVLAWFAPLGLWAWSLAALALFELGVTLIDFVEEDRTRTLPPFERVLHTLLAINLGVMGALIAPQWLAWSRAPSALHFVPHGLWSILLSLAALGVFAWGVRNALATHSLYVRRTNAHTLPVPANGSARTLLITGATGFLGVDLVRRRLARGDCVIVQSRDPKRAEALFDGRVLAVHDLAQLPDSLHIHAIVNLAGAGVANALWTRARKTELARSRLSACDAIARLSARLHEKPEVLVSASAIGFYGDGGDNTLTEHSPPGHGFSSELCLAWETAAARAGAHAKRLVRVRFGVVLGRGGGAFPKLTTALPFGVAAQFGDGRHWMSWIHKHDALRVLDAAIEDQRVAGAVNAVAPSETRHRDIIDEIAHRAGAIKLAAPAPLLRTALGKMSELFLDSQRVAPRALEALGFSFHYPDISTAVADLLAKPQSEHAPHQHALRKV